MELLDTPSSGRGSLELEGVSPLKELLCRAYSVHVDIITDLQKQVSSLTALLTEKERELQDTTCQRCDSVKAAFERYKANHQRIIEKQEDKISLLENRISRYEKEQRERDGSPTVCFRTPDRATPKGPAAAGGCRRQFPNSPFSAHRGMDDTVLQEDSPMDPSHLVPPSPDGCDAHSKHETIPETELGGHKLGARERPLAMLFRTVPETLECDLYGDTDNDITQYVPPLSAVLEQEEGGGPSNGLNVRDDEGPSDPEKGKVERGMVERVDPSVDNAAEEEEVIDLVSQESPSLLQPRSTISRSIKVHCEAPTAVDAPTDASDGSSCVPPVQPAPSVLDSFAVPKPLPKPGDSRGVTAPAGRDDFVCSPETRRPTTKTLSLQRKRRTAEISKVTDDTGAQVRTTAKRKKQTKLSDKYFLSVNRCTPPVRAKSSRKPAKELSQTHVDTHFTEDSVFSPNKRTVDPDETFVAPELLQDEFSPSVFDPLPPATQEEGPTGDKPGANGAVDSPADKGSASSAEPVKYHHSPVRKKAARQKLPAHDCKDCKEFYGRLDLPEGKRKELLRKCSRHRAMHAPPPTPDHFWELDFPDTQECRERGYLNATQKYVLGSKRLFRDDAK
ncbi:uncharacterized protein LOC144175863 isoform X2 [Haemaphysalis longicornis]